MKVEFAPNNAPPLTGAVSFLSYADAEFQKAVRQMFNESPREQITEIRIERDGIKAKFESKYPAAG
jgi:hypothetical protein